jgi:hypothetical protein
VSRYKAECELVFIPDYCFGYLHWRESGFITVIVVIQGAENTRKNRDEFINYTVRVSFSTPVSQFVFV